MAPSKDSKQPLLKEDNLQQVQDTSNTLPKWRQLATIFIIQFMQFGAFCSDSAIFTFFPLVSKDRGLSFTEIGVIFSAYDVTKCISAPICGSMVSMYVYSKLS